MTVAPAVQGMLRTTSPSLRGFESSPFRMLRLPVTATTSGAARQAETALTLSRVGLSPDEPDPLPWAPSADTFELQRAAQSAEEPLIRLKSQLLWFDCEREPKAQVLVAALADPSSGAMRTYLAEELKLTDPSSGADKKTAHGLIAHAINQANLRLLMAAAATNGYLRSATVERTSLAIAAEKWTSLNGFRALPQVHAVFARLLSTEPGWAAAGVDWQGALQRWTAILADARFKSYLTACINDLEDDFVSVNDIEVVEESVRTHLADLAAQEARFLVLEGRYPLARSVISAVAASGMELRVVAPAMRPLRQVFQSEIAELDTLIETSDQTANGIDAYVKRLQAIRERWITLDASSVVGLRDILDQAFEGVYLRLRQMEKVEPAAVDRLLQRIAGSVSAESLKERVLGFEKELAERRTRLCHFCKTGTPDYDQCVVLQGKKETGRTESFGTTTIHYSLRYAIVLRCARCARLHTFIRQIGVAFLIALIPGIVALVRVLAGVE